MPTSLSRILKLLTLLSVFSVQSAIADELENVSHLAQQYEHAEGRPKDLTRAIDLYCEAARRGNAQSQYDLGWMYANGRGTDRNDAFASYLFAQASVQGHVHAKRMLQYVQGTSSVPPPCYFKPKLTTRLSVKP